MSITEKRRLGGCGQVRGVVAQASSNVGEVIGGPAQAGTLVPPHGNAGGTWAYECVVYSGSGSGTMEFIHEHREGLELAVRGCCIGDDGGGRECVCDASGGAG